MAIRVDRLQVSLEATGEGQFKAALESGAESVRKVDTVTKSGRQSIMAMADAERKAAADAAALAEAKRQEEEAIRQSDRAAKDWTNTLKQLGVGAAITAILKQTVETIAAYEEIDDRLKQVTQSQQGVADAMLLSRAAVSGTNAGVLDMANAYVELREKGIIPTLETLQAANNIAAARGKELTEVAGAMAEAARGNLGGFAALGIEAQKAGDDIVVTFDGVTTTLENNRTAILGYLEDIGNNRYADAAADQADRLGGAWAATKNSASELADTLGTVLSPVLKSLLDEVTSLIAGLGKLDARRAMNWRVDDFMSRNFKPEDLVAVGAGPRGDPLGGLDPNAAAVAAANERAAAQAALNAELQMGADNLAKLTVADAEANAEGQKALARMADQLAVVGQSRGEAIEYAAAQQAAKTADKELAAQIIATGKALADKVRALDAVKKATKEAKETQRELRAELSDGEKAYRQYMREIMADEQAMIDGWHNTDKLREAVEKLDASFDPAAEGMRKMLAAEKLLDEAYRAGVITLEQYDALLEKVFKKEQEIGKTNRVATVWSSFTGASEEDSARTIEDMGDAFAKMFADSMMKGFKDIDKDLGNLFKNVFAQAAQETIKNKLVKNVQNWANGGQFNTQDAVQGGSAIVGTYVGTAVGGDSQGSQGGAMAGAQAGAMIGSYFGPWGTLIGAVLGGIIGAIAGADGPPEVDVRGSAARRFGDQEAHAVGPYGAVGVTTRDIDVVAAEFAAAIVALDTAISKVLTVEENRRVREAMTTFDVNNARSPGEAMAARLNAIIKIVEPNWIAFLERYNDVGERAAAFGALRGMKEMIKDIDTVTTQLVGGSLGTLRASLTKLDTDVESSMGAFRSAWEAGDPVQMEAEGKRAMQAIIDRYNAEIELVTQLQAAIEQAQAEAYQLNMTIAQRLSAITGDYSAPVAISAARMTELRDGVGAAANAQAALALLNQFVASVDAWVSARTAEINAELNAGLADIERRRSIIVAQQQAEQQAAQAANAARQREIAALQEQLRLANEWLSVLQAAKAQQQAMQFGAANPLSGFGRLDAIDRQIAGMGDVSSLDASQATDLLSLLEQRLQLIMSEGLFDRPSDDYLDRYNETLRMIDLVRQLASPGAESAEDLQRRIAALQAQLVDATTSGFSSTNSALQALQAEEEALRADAKEKLDEMNRRAKEQYEWARTEAERNQDARTKELRDQLEELTGGLSVQEFIALKQNEANGLLTEIRNNLREFLQYVGDLGPGSSVRTPGSGGGPRTPRIENPTGINIELNIDARGASPFEIGEQVQREIMRSASLIKRELNAA